MKMDFSPKESKIHLELMPIVKELLDEGKTVRNLPFRGFSMLPMLRQETDTVDLSPLPPKLQKYDLPVYRYPSGKIVMHRVVDVKEDHYICLGDNTYQYEKIRPEQMIGMVTSFKRGEKRIAVDALSYRIYCRIWVAIYPLRRVIHRAKSWLRRLLKGLLRRLLK